MDVLFALGQATVNEVRDKLADPPGPTAVRTFMHILKNKGLVTRRKNGREYVYRPRPQRRKAGQTALRQVINTFFSGSMEDAIAAHLADREAKLSEEELKRIKSIIDESRKERGR